MDIWLRLKVYYYILLGISPFLIGIGIYISEVALACPQYKRTVCTEYQGIVTRIYQKRYFFFDIQTSGGIIKYNTIPDKLSELVEVNDSLYKIKGKNECLVIKKDGRRFRTIYLGTQETLEKYKDCSCDQPHWLDFLIEEME